MIMKIPSLLIDVAGPIAGVKIARRSPIVSLGIPKREDIVAANRANLACSSVDGVLHGVAQGLEHLVHATRCQRQRS